jgi:hypothetical protein
MVLNLIYLATAFASGVIVAGVYILKTIPVAVDFETRKLRLAASMFTGIMLLFIFITLVSVGRGGDLSMFDTTVKTLTPLAGVIVGYFFGTSRRQGEVAASERENFSERVADVRWVAEQLVVDLVDGRTIAVPLAWYPRLLSATPAQRANWIKAGGGFGIHWPDVDEDLSVAGLLRGTPAPDARRRAVVK